MATHAQREEMQRIMRLLVSRKRKVHYAQVRPMRTNTIHSVPALCCALRRPSGITMDCSESVTLICRLSGLRDPNGLHYNGSGYTGTLLDFLPHYSNPGQARPGALWCVGDGTGEHVTMKYDEERWFSHGTEADPSFYTLDELIAAFPGKPYTFLSIAGL